VLIKILELLIEQLILQGYAHPLREVTPPLYFAIFRYLGIKMTSSVSTLFRWMGIGFDKN